jgi:hypothetical protein
MRPASGRIRCIIMRAQWFIAPVDETGERNAQSRTAFGVSVRSSLRT